MYLAVDIGGTKTLVASLDDRGVITERVRIPTAKEYSEFKRDLADTVAKLSTKEFVAAGVSAPGRIHHGRGIGIAMGNLPWVNTPIQRDVSRIADCPAVLDNDANLAGLSEAMLLKDIYQTVLYVTIGTGIGTSLIVNQKITLPHMEGGHMLLEYQGKWQEWEDFASGRSIVARFGKKARDITSEAAWKDIAHTTALGLQCLIAITQPDVIVIGGGVSEYAHRLKVPLEEELKRHESPLTPTPRIEIAKRPDDAVLYGCYDLARSTYGSVVATA